MNTRQDANESLSLAQRLEVFTGYCQEFPARQANSELTVQIRRLNAVQCSCTLPERQSILEETTLTLAKIREFDLAGVWDLTLQN